ncbi:MAG: ABC transporter ATP-binding protein [Desulfuromonadales bacterium]|nr:ABC transporter ATP-binding protein [Desulfuromonadales bacterium]
MKPLDCLEIKNLTVTFPLSAGTLWAVNDVSFTLARGETLGIVGESGCGKSMTAMAIMNLLPQAAQLQATGLTFNGQELTALNESEMSDIRGNRMAMIFQEPMTSLNPAFTVGAQLMEAILRHRKVKKSEARERALYLLEKVGITAAASRLRQYPHELSGGLRQRVMIAMALMCSPDLIIADEPTTALDVTIQAQILHLLTEIQREFEMTVIMITHDLGVVANVTDRVAVMYAGRIVETGLVSQLFESPQHPYTQKLLDCIPVPGKTKRGSYLGSIPGRVPSLIGDLSGCSFANRCSFCTDECLNNDPPWHQIGSQRGYLCWRNPEQISPYKGQGVSL